MKEYRMAVEFLIGRVEDIIENIYENGHEDEYEKDIKALKKRIEVVRKCEG